MKVNRVMFNAMFNLLVLLRQVVVGVRRRQVVVVSSGQVRLFLFHGLRGIAVVGSPICLRFFFGGLLISIRKHPVLARAVPII